MNSIEYKINIGSYTVSNNPQHSSFLLTYLKCELDLMGFGSQSIIKLNGAESFDVESGESVDITLMDSSGESTVFTGIVTKISITATTIIIFCQDIFYDLYRTHLERSFTEVSAGYIVNDILNYTGARTGEIEDGPTFASYVLHNGPSAFCHLAHLSQLSGAFLYSTGDGSVHFKTPGIGMAFNTFYIGQDVLDFNIQKMPNSIGTVQVYGEGAASEIGAEKSHWLAVDLTSVKREASVSGESSNSILLTCGAIRTGENADYVANALKLMIEDRPFYGFIKVIGSHSIQPGDLVNIEKYFRADLNIPSIAQSNARVRKVIHYLNQKDGFITRLEF